MSFSIGSAMKSRAPTKTSLIDGIAEGSLSVQFSIRRRSGSKVQRARSWVLILRTTDSGLPAIRSECGVSSCRETHSSSVRELTMKGRQLWRRSFAVGSIVRHDRVDITGPRKVASDGSTSSPFVYCCRRHFARSPYERSRWPPSHRHRRGRARRPPATLSPSLQIRRATSE